jgi:hypothetical protein
MPKPYTFPTLYDEVKTVEISFLKMHGYLKTDQIKRGTMTCRTNAQKTGSISILVNMNETTPYIEFDYKCNDEPINYKVSIIDIPSNLGKGKVFLFQCPRSHKLCRKLYLAETYFLHRSAFKGCMYECQTQGKKYRATEKTFGCYFKLDGLYKQLYKKNFKKTYGGRPTKKYFKLMEQKKKWGNHLRGA